MSPKLGRGYTLEEVEQVLIDRHRINKDGCWIWTGAIGTHGYGRIRYEGREWRVHRLAAYLWLGVDWDTTPVILHRSDCDKLCINPDHLYVGTQRENVADYLARKHGV